MTMARELRLTAAILVTILGASAMAEAAFPDAEKTVALEAKASNAGIAVVPGPQAGMPGTILFGNDLPRGLLPFGGPR